MPARVMCRAEGCPRHATIALPGQRPRHCKAHKTAGEVNVVRRLCAERGCGRRPSFAVLGERARHCGVHKKAGEVDVVHRKCAAPGCRREPLFAVLGERGRHCGVHKTAGEVNVKSRKCAERGCRREPSFAVLGQRARHCLAHKMAGEVNVTSHKCAELGCGRQPSFAVLGERARHCGVHKTAGEVHVVSRKCAVLGCGRQPSFAVLGERARHCGVHRMAGEVNVVHRGLASALIVLMTPPPPFTPDCVKISSALAARYLLRSWLRALDRTERGWLGVQLAGSYRLLTEVETLLKPGRKGSELTRFRLEQVVVCFTGNGFDAEDVEALVQHDARDTLAREQAAGFGQRVQLLFKVDGLASGGAKYKNIRNSVVLSLWVKERRVDVVPVCELVHDAPTTLSGASTMSHKLAGVDALQLSPDESYELARVPKSQRVAALAAQLSSAPLAGAAASPSASTPMLLDVEGDPQLPTGRDAFVAVIEGFGNNVRAISLVFGFLATATKSLWRLEFVRDRLAKLGATPAHALQFYTSWFRDRSHVALAAALTDEAEADRDELGAAVVSPSAAGGGSAAAGAAGGSDSTDSTWHPSDEDADDEDEDDEDSADDDDDDDADDEDDDEDSDDDDDGADAGEVGDIVMSPTVGTRGAVPVAGALDPQLLRILAARPPAATGGSPPRSTPAIIPRKTPVGGGARAPRSADAAASPLLFLGGGSSGGRGGGVGRYGPPQGAPGSAAAGVINGGGLSSSTPAPRLFPLAHSSQGGSDRSVGGRAAASSLLRRRATAVTAASRGGSYDHTHDVGFGRGGYNSTAGPGWHGGSAGGRAGGGAGGGYYDHHHHDVGVGGGGYSSTAGPGWHGGGGGGAHHYGPPLDTNGSRRGGASVVNPPTHQLGGRSQPVLDPTLQRLGGSLAAGGHPLPPASLLGMSGSRDDAAAVRSLPGGHVSVVAAVSSAGATGSGGSDLRPAACEFSICSLARHLSACFSMHLCVRPPPTLPFALLTSSPPPLSPPRMPPARCPHTQSPQTPPSPRPRGPRPPCSRGSRNLASRSSSTLPRQRRLQLLASARSGRPSPPPPSRTLRSPRLRVLPFP